jgi:Domain of unknown function (DUF4390)
MPAPPFRRRALRLKGPLPSWLLASALVLSLLFATGSAWAQGVELTTLKVSREEGGLNLEFAARVALPKAVEDALERGVPIYFVAQADLRRSRWYWRDERVSRVTRSWRIAYQPLTGFWRVALGGLSQTHASLADALSAASRSASWRLAEQAQIEGEKGHYVEFSYRLDTAQLPGPMQFGLVGASDWAVSVERALRID